MIGELDLSALSLDVASLVGFTNWAEPQVLQEITTYLLEQYMRIAMEYGVDYVWVLESFAVMAMWPRGPWPTLTIVVTVKMIHPYGLTRAARTPMSVGIVHSTTCFRASSPNSGLFTSRNAQLSRLNAIDTLVGTYWPH